MKHYTTHEITRTVNEVYEISKTIFDGIKSFRTYNTDFDLDDYLIIVEPCSDKVGYDYQIIITDWSSNDVFAIIPFWNGSGLTVESISDEILKAIFKYELD